MSLYRRGKTWWFVFELGGRKVQESSGFQNKTAALRVEAKRKIDLLERHAGFTKLKAAPKFDEFVESFLEWSGQQHRPKTHGLHQWNCQTLKRFFKGKYLDEITPEIVADFKSARKHETREKAKDGRTIHGRDRQSSVDYPDTSFPSGGALWLFRQKPSCWHLDVP